MSKLLNAIKNTPQSVTANGALTFDSSNSLVLDLFSHGAAMKNSSDADIVAIFRKAFGENKLLAMKTLFYIRDVRGGQGCRKFFRVCYNWLAQNHPSVAVGNIKLVSEFGRFDDLFAGFNTKSEVTILSYIKDVFAQDLSSLASGRETSVSLLGKWLPSINASSKTTRVLANKIRVSLGLNPVQYRKSLSLLRSKIDIVEKKMCSKEWSDIEFSKVPSKASLLYRKAFYKNDEDRYAKYLLAVTKGEAKINAGTLYPSDIVGKVFGGEGIETLDALWNALPNFLENNPHNGLVVADVSGSMMGTPLNVSISLAMYFAERNVGLFKDHFITFSGNPKLQKVVGNSIYEKVMNLSRAEWQQNTNLQAVFDLVLSVAVKNKLPQSELPSTIFIISDMQFDIACSGNKSTNFEVAKKKFEDCGYEIPTIAFWNVNSSGTGSPVTRDERGTMLVSGYSPSILKYVLAGEVITPYDMMMEVLDSERYASVTV